MVERKALPTRILNTFRRALGERLEREADLFNGCEIDVVRAAKAIFLRHCRAILVRRVTVDRFICSSERHLIQPAESWIQDIRCCPGQKDDDNNRSDTPGDRKHWL